MTGMPSDLRVRLAADYAPVRPLPAPWVRAVWVAPLALVTFVAAPAAFGVRADAGQLGWIGGGASLCQVVVGFALVAASLRESIPGRAWSRGAVSLLMMLPIALMVVITIAAWDASQVRLGRGWWAVGGICFGGSAASALPVVALAGILAARAYPVRPAVAGALLGLGAGLVADAGWRMFCHFTEPAHVLSAHLGGVIASLVFGVLLSIRLKADTTRQLSIPDSQ